jgi:hypothetical protein
MQAERRIVARRDLVDILRQFDRLDAEARLGYPPHIAQLADAATNAIGWIPPGDVRGQLKYALNLVRPAR